jgi:hypothetical protein
MSTRSVGDRLRQCLHWAPRRLLLQLYPRAWRQRYSAEFAMLLMQQRLTLQEILDIVYAAVDAHRRAKRPAHDIAQTGTPQGTPLQFVECARAQDGRERSMARVGRHFACSFCGKNQDHVRRLIAGPTGVYICDECISLCNEIIEDGEHGEMSQRAEGTPPTRHHPRPWQATPRWRRLVRRWLLADGEQLFSRASS